LDFLSFEPLDSVKIRHIDFDEEETMTTVTLDLPDDVFSALRSSPQDFGREMRLAAAIHWYQRGEVSQEKAAQIAGLNRADFLAALAREQVDVFQVDFEDLKRELDRA
jgi:predicted HTH domain antitoxin